MQYYHSDNSNNFFNHLLFFLHFSKYSDWAKGCESSRRGCWSGLIFSCMSVTKVTGSTEGQDFLPHSLQFKVHHVFPATGWLKGNAELIFWVQGHVWVEALFGLTKAAVYAGDLECKAVSGSPHLWSTTFFQNLK